MFIFTELVANKHMPLLDHGVVWIAFDAAGV